MSHKPYQWNVICDVCGTEFKSGQVRKRWDGLVVCDADFELDHPQKYIRVHSDPVPVPAELIRQEPEDVFIFVCTRYTQQGLADIGTADCMQANINNNLPYSIYGTI
jgi:hypothetical protein